MIATQSFQRHRAALLPGKVEMTVKDQKASTGLQDIMDGVLSSIYSIGLIGRKQVVLKAVKNSENSTGGRLSPCLIPELLVKNTDLL